MASSDDRNPSYRPLPPAFIESVASRPGLASALDGESPVSIRINPYKPYIFPSDHIFASLKPVPWASENGQGEGYYLPERPIFTTDPVFHGGAYYVQEAGSMFVGWLLRRILDEEPLSDSLRVLDLCAAPGGKTTHLASVIGLAGVVVANEVIKPRARILAENVQKWGSGNVAVISNDPSDFGQRLPDFFDVIVVDAPCSGEGMFRKDHAAREEWSPENVQLCAARQRRIVSDVWEALRPGGVMIYSTCTFNSAEDEENVRWIADTLGGEILHFTDIPVGIVSGNDGLGWHFYPHLVRSEGFFAAAIRKTDTHATSFLPVRGKTKGDAKGLIAASKAEVAEALRWLAPTANNRIGNPGHNGYNGNNGEGQLCRFAIGGDGALYGFSEAMYETVSALLQGRFGLIYSGVQMGELIRGTLKPGHPLALYYGTDRDAVQVVTLDDPAAMEYLRKGTAAELLPVTSFSEGLNLVTCRGITLGWVKRIGNRYNNQYPQNWRVLHY